MDRLRAMQLFIRVCETGSFSETARELGIAQSVVSRHVARLESDLGVTLLRRTTRQVTLTEVGRRYSERVKNALTHLASAEDEIADELDEPSGQIRITAPTSFGRRFVIPTVVKFLERYPRVSIECVLRDSYVDLISERIDLAVRFGQLKDSSLKMRKLGVSRLLPVASADVVKRHGAAFMAGRYEGIPAILVRSGPRLSRGLEAVDGTVVEPERARLIVDNIEAAQEAAIAGAGVTALPHWLVSGDLAAGRLSRISPRLELSPMPVSLVHLPEARLAARTRALSALMHDDLSNVFRPDGGE